MYGLGILEFQIFWYHVQQEPLSRQLPYPHVWYLLVPWLLSLHNTSHPPSPLYVALTSHSMAVKLVSMREDSKMSVQRSIGEAAKHLWPSSSPLVYFCSILAIKDISESSQVQGGKSIDFTFGCTHRGEKHWWSPFWWKLTQSPSHSGRMKALSFTCWFLLMVTNTSTHVQRCKPHSQIHTL